MPANARAVFLDRDGTLNEDPGYLSSPEQLKLFADVGLALRKLKDAGFLLVVVSNQSGVGRGLIEAEALTKIHARMDELLRADGVAIDHYEVCPLLPDDPESRRKPKPDLIIDAARKLGIDVTRSFMIGDRGTDVEAGLRANCRGVALVQTGVEDKELTGRPHFVGRTLLEVADWILAQERTDS